MLGLRVVYFLGAIHRLRTRGLELPALSVPIHHRCNGKNYLYRIVLIHSSNTYIEGSAWGAARIIETPG